MTRPPTKKELKEWSKLGYYILGQRSYPWPINGWDKEDLVQYLLMEIHRSHMRGKSWDPSLGTKSSLANCILHRKIARLLEKSRTRIKTHASLRSHEGDEGVAPTYERRLDIAQDVGEHLSSLSERERELWDLVMFGSEPLSSALPGYGTGEKKQLLSKIEEWVDSRSS